MSTDLYNILDKVTPEDSDHHVEQKVLLWTNSDPMSNFPTQTLTVSDMSNYSYIEVTYNFSNQYSSYQQATTKAPFILDKMVSLVGEFINSVDSRGCVCSRDLKFTSNTTIWVDTSWYVNVGGQVGGVTYGSIPTKIYGIKNLES